MSKNTILTGGICFLLVFLLLHPAESLSCARAGMTLWLNTLIPTLLPFIILTGMLTHTGHIRKLLLPFESFFHIFPGVSIWGGYVFVLGMLCGYPLGAKLASDLYGLHKISKKEALYLTGRRDGFRQGGLTLGSGKKRWIRLWQNLSCI